MDEVCVICGNLERYCRCDRDPGLTEAEKLTLGQLASAWNNFVGLNPGEYDLSEFTDAIHRAQHLVAVRVARRINPEFLRQ